MRVCGSIPVGKSRVGWLLLVFGCQRFIARTIIGYNFGCRVCGLPSWVFQEGGRDRELRVDWIFRGIFYVHPLVH